MSQAQGTECGDIRIACSPIENTVNLKAHIPLSMWVSDPPSHKAKSQLLNMLAGDVHRYLSSEKLFDRKNPKNCIHIRSTRLLKVIAIFRVDLMYLVYVTPGGGSQ